MTAELRLHGRRKRIVLLISSRLDYRFEPLTFTAKVVQRGAQAGGRVSTKRKCGKCGGTGDLRWKNRTVKCDQCDGAGTLNVDAYTGDRLQTPVERNEYGTPFGMTFSEHLSQLIERDTWYVPCPDCQNLKGEPTGVVHRERCRRCDGTGHAAVPGSWLSEPDTDHVTLGGDQESAMLRMLDKRDHAGSYRDLERLYATLPSRWRRLLDLLFLEHAVEFTQLDPLDRERVESALDTLDAAMPDPIRVPTAIVENEKVQEQRRTRAHRATGSDPKAIQQRNREIVKLARQGKPAQWIAAEYGVSPASVYAVVAAADRKHQEHVA